MKNPIKILTSLMENLEGDERDAVSKALETITQIRNFESSKPDYASKLKGFNVHDYFVAALDFKSKTLNKETCMKDMEIDEETYEALVQAISDHAAEVEYDYKGEIPQKFKYMAMGAIDGQHFVVLMKHYIEFDYSY